MLPGLITTTSYLEQICPIKRGRFGILLPLIASLITTLLPLLPLSALIAAVLNSGGGGQTVRVVLSFMRKNLCNDGLFFFLQHAIDNRRWNSLRPFRFFHFQPLGGVRHGYKDTGVHSDRILIQIFRCLYSVGIQRFNTIQCLSILVFR